MKACFIALFSLLILSHFSDTFAAPQGPVEGLKIKTKRGTELNAKLHLPWNNGTKVPAILIAPGEGYHMDRPIIEQLADQAAAQGIIALRFNWQYFGQPNGRPSQSLSNERDDLESALDYLKQHPNVDANKIMLAGKSLGTMVAYPLFQAEPSLVGLFLLTPVCTYSWDENDLPVDPYAVGQIHYANIQQEKRPIHVTLGNNDALCHLSMLYDFLKVTQGNVSTAVFGGDHSLNIGAADDPSFQTKNDANIKAAVAANIQWMKLVLGL